jgi:cytochrome c-L
MPYLHRLVAATVCASACFWSLSAVAEGTEFKHPLDGSPIVFALKPGEMETPALKEFKATGRNAYRGDPAAITQGRELYETWCQACHNSDGSGRLGPPLIGKDHIYDQTNTDAGMFAIIFAGATGAMQPFSLRDVTQDQMLKMVAYIRSIDK